MVKMYKILAIFCFSNKNNAKSKKKVPEQLYFKILR